MAFLVVLAEFGRAEPPPPTRTSVTGPSVTVPSVSGPSVSGPSEPGATAAGRSGAGPRAGTATDLASPLPSLPAPLAGNTRANQPAGAPRTTAERTVPVNTMAETPGAETLEQAWATALAVDRRLSAGVERVEADRNLLAASTAERLPIVTAQGAYNVRDNERAFQITTPALPFTLVNPYQQREDLTFAGRVRVPVYTGGTVTHNIDAARARVCRSQSELDTYQQSLMMQVAREFIDVLRAEQAVRVANSHARSLQAHTRDVRSLYQCQRVPRNDLLAAEVAWAESQHEAMRSANRLRIAQAAYNRRLGRPLDSPVRLSAPTATEQFPALDVLTSQALAGRAELAELDAQARALRHQAAALSGKRLPQVAVEGSYSFQENQFQTPEGIATLGIGGTWELYDGGRIARQANALLQRARAVAHLREDWQSRIQLQVRSAWLDLQDAGRRLQVARDAVNRAEENLRVTRQRYHQGMATNTTVLEAETLRTNALNNFHNATLDLALKTIELKRAVGLLPSS